MTDDDFKAGLDMAKEAEKRTARPAPKKKTTAKKAAVKKTARKVAKKPASAQKSAAKPKAATGGAKPKPKAAEAAAPKAPAAASLAGLETYLETWAAARARVQESCVESGRLAAVTALELGRRNLELQRDVIAQGLKMGRSLRP